MTASSKSSFFKTCLTILFTIIATFFTWWAALGCRFFTSNLIEVSGWRDGSIATEVQMSFGLWSKANGFTINENSPGCVWYDREVSFDSPMKSARATSMIALILSLPLMVLPIYNFLQSPTRQSIYTLLSLSMLLVAILSALNFVALHTEQCTADFALSCQIATDGYLSIVSIALWTLSALLTITTRVAQDETSNTSDWKAPSVSLNDEVVDAVDGGLQTHRRSLGNGSIKVTTTQRNPDGSLTVVKEEVLREEDFADVEL